MLIYQMSHFKNKQIKIQKMIKESNSRATTLYQITDNCINNTNCSGIIDVVTNIFPQKYHINPDVYIFSKILFTELGSRYRYLDMLENPAPSQQISNSVIDDQTTNIAITLINIENSQGKIKNLVYMIGKKIAPRGINPYLTTDIETNKELCNDTKILDNPDDVYTFMNCLDVMINKGNIQQTNESTDIHLQYYLKLLEELKVEYYNDSLFNNDQLLSTNGNFDIFRFVLLLIKMDTLLFSILYRLGINDVFISPLTGVYYNKRKKVGSTPHDAFVAGYLLEQILDTIFKFITSNNPIDVVEIMETYFNTDSTNSDYNEDQIIEKSKIPPMMYGQLLCMCDVAYQAYQKALPPTGSTVNILASYDSNIFKQYVIDSLFSLKAISEIIEQMMCSKAFITVLSYLYPTENNGTPNTKAVVTTDFLLYKSNNRVDLLNMLLTAIFGPEKFNLSLFIPSKTLPDIIQLSMIPINTAQLYIMHNKLATISRLLFGKNAPILKESDFHNMNDDPPGPATESMDIPITGPSYVSWKYINQLMEINTYAETINGYIILPIYNYIQTYIDLLYQLDIQNIRSLSSVPNLNIKLVSRNILYQPKPLIKNKPRPLAINRTTPQTLDERVKKILGHHMFT